jgi:GR25 family glycosyltransferase involved in LPS biosynthesis
MLEIGVSQELINKGRGLAGCAASHMKLWKYIADNNLDWVLILEDDAHFHPQFMELFHQYWKNVPKYAKIVFPGWCAQCGISNRPILEESCMCLHGYMINGPSAKFLLENLPKMTEPIDIVITEFFRNRPGSMIFNENSNMNGIIPNKYKDTNGRRCMFNGIIYQNHQEQGSTIHQENTVF